MLPRLRGWVLASVVALHTAVAGAAGIDEVYEKPAAAKSWGELLAQFLGVQGVGKSYALVVGVSEYRGGFPPLVATRSDPDPDARLPAARGRLRLCPRAHQ